MGHPVNGIEYILNNWEYLRGRYPYYVFFLFTDENRSFTKFFHEHFYKLDQISAQGCMFFAVAPPPPGWQEIAQEREYWKHYLADPEANIGYDQAAVYQAARYFDVPREYLPAAIIFQDIKRDEALTIHLDELGLEEWPGFFTNLFQIFNLVQSRDVQDLYLRGLKKLINFMPARSKSSEWLLDFAREIAPPRSEKLERRGNRYFFNQQELPKRQAAYRTEYPGQIEAILQGMQAEITRLSGEVAAMRNEQREGFRQVNLHLEHIEAVLGETIQRIEAFREPFVERWFALENSTASLDELIETREALQAEFDTFLIEQSQHLAQRLDFRLAKIPSSLQHLEHLFEPPAKSSLVTAELLWKELQEVELSWLDYSVCGIGLWKALEIELNRTFVDALRVSHHLCQPGIFSIDQIVETSGELTEPAQVRGGKVQINKRYVLDKEKNIQKLLGIELGGVAGLLLRNAENRLAALAGKVALQIPVRDNDVQTFLREVGSQVSTVANSYRNSHAHIRPMSRAKCQEFREFILDDKNPHNPLLATLSCKQGFLKAGMI